MEVLSFSKARLRVQLLCLSRAINEKRLALEEEEEKACSSEVEDAYHRSIERRIPTEPISSPRSGEVVQVFISSLDEGEEFITLFTSLMRLNDLLIEHLVELEVSFYHRICVYGSICLYRFPISFSSSLTIILCYYEHHHGYMCMYIFSCMHP